MAESKPWPAKKPVNFRDLRDPVCEAIRFVYDMRRLNPHRDIPWTGYNIGDRELVGSFPPHEKLKCSQLEYDEKEQGRDALTVLVGIAIQLGIEQGRRMEHEAGASDRDFAKACLEITLRSLGG